MDVKEYDLFELSVADLFQAFKILRNLISERKFLFHKKNFSPQRFHEAKNAMEIINM
jgi:hypothetical protein